MIRTQIYLTEKEKSDLSQLAGAVRKTQSELIREAIDSLLTRSKSSQMQEILERTAGIWKHRKDLPDFTELRNEWDREGSR